mmetsp:Transcript_31910/g.71874  ORF Transcript_31910/g.71874 Transcript_31910/m.71874 type:complete len:206 (+) Transcript_31910:634-1251(+)
MAHGSLWSSRAAAKSKEVPRRQRRTPTPWVTEFITSASTEFASRSMASPGRPSFLRRSAANATTHKPCHPMALTLRSINSSCAATAPPSFELKAGKHIAGPCSSSYPATSDHGTPPPFGEPAPPSLPPEAFSRPWRDASTTLANPSTVSLCSGAGPGPMACGVAGLAGGTGAPKTRGSVVTSGAQGRQQRQRNPCDPPEWLVPEW